MENLDRLVYINRFLNSKLEEEKWHDSQNMIKDYYVRMQQQCAHTEFYDSGYYRLSNDNVIASTRLDAEFRMVTCSICETSIMLLKNPNPAWDSIYGNLPITVHEKNKIKTKM